MLPWLPPQKVKITRLRCFTVLGLGAVLYGCPIRVMESAVVSLLVVD